MDPYKTHALIYKAYCDENRLKIIDVLTLGEHCACDLLEQLTIGQSTLSHHMKILNEAGLINDRKEGKNIYYSLKNEVFDELHTTLGNLYKDKMDCICHSIKK